MLINLIQDTVGQNGTAPAYFMQDMQLAANMLSAAFTDNITINLRVGWGSANNVVDSSLNGSGSAYAGGLNGTRVSLSTVKSWLTSSSTSTNDTQAYSTLAGLSLSNSTTIYVDRAQEKALGQISATSTTLDGYAAFGTGISNATLIGVALHEMTHAMGRNMNSYSPAYPNLTIMDLFRYGSAGNLRTTGGSSAYFSINGGVTDLADFGVSSDYGDLLNSSSRSTNDSFNEFYNSSTFQFLTSLDKLMMDVLGFSTRIGGGRGKTAEPSDILWVNGQSVGQWTMTNNNPTWNYLSTNTNGWSVVGNGDYNGDGSRDILWFNAASQQLGDWTGDIKSNPQWNLLSTNANGWQVVGSGDYNGDGTSDILWYNISAQQLGEWKMTGNSPTWQLLSSNVNGWSVVGSGDYSGDGKSDVLWYNSQAQQLGEWTDVGGSNSWQLLSSNTNGWTIVGSGDYNGDGKADLLWYNAATRQLGDWTNVGTSNTWSLLSSNTNGWTVVSSGDYNGDGTDDILWYNAATQQLGDWIMVGNSPTWNLLSDNTNGWRITGGQT